MRALWRGVAVFASAATVTSVFFINFCATIFRCGCSSLWSGAAAHCNIHSAGGHHCPWCAHTSWVPWLLIVGVQAAIAFWPRALPVGARLAVGIAAFPIAGAAIALAYGLADRYW